MLTRPYLLCLLIIYHSRYLSYCTMIWILFICPFSEFLSLSGLGLAQAVNALSRYDAIQVLGDFPTFCSISVSFPIHLEELSLNLDIFTVQTGSMLKPSAYIPIRGQSFEGKKLFQKDFGWSKQNLIKCGKNTTRCAADNKECPWWRGLAGASANIV